jgi:two-component system response regulator LytT
MRILIIEDEDLAVRKLQKCLAEIAPEAQVVGVTDSIASSVAWLQQHAPPNVILSDIELTDGQSFEVFRKVSVESMLIFTTSYDQYAMRAFKLNSIDYLLKPIQKEELKAALDKYKRYDTISNPMTSTGPKDMEQLLRSLQQTQGITYRKRFLVKHLQRLASIAVEEIAYFYFDDLTFFKTHDNKRYTVDYTLDEIENMLDPGEFFRTSRSYIVALKSIQKIEDYFGYRLYLKLSPANDKDALVSREKVNAFKKWLGK